VATNTERLDQHQKEIAGVVTDLVRLQEITRAAEAGIESRIAGIEDTLKQVRAELSETRTAVARLDERLKVLERLSDHPATLAAHDQRLKALEKGTDRLWQFAPIVLSGLALLTAAYVAFVKK
jgi:predicted RecB family endonuclease